MTKELILIKNNKQITLMDKNDIQSTYATKEEVNNIASGSNGVDITLIGSKDEISSNGIYFYVELPLTLTVEENNITFFKDNYAAQFNVNNSEWLYGSGNVTVDWGDGSTNTIIRDESISHTYTDGLSSHDVTFHGNITAIGPAAFAGCSISKAIIPSTINSIENASFCYSEIQDVIIRCNSIGVNSFAGCEFLRNVEIDETKYIYSAFNNCNSLKSVSISSSVTNMYESFLNSNYITDYQLYWTNDNIIGWDNDRMPVNENTIFNIPYGETQNYIANDYPEELLVERS